MAVKGYDVVLQLHLIELAPPGHRSQDRFVEWKQSLEHVFRISAQQHLDC